MYYNQCSPRTRARLADVMVPFPFGQFTAELFNDDAAFRPRVDVAETDTAFELHVALPGLKKEDIRLEVKSHTLTISGERKQSEKTFRSTETRYGKFSRSFSLSDKVDTASITAEFKDGILEVLIPKKETEKPVAVEIAVK